MWLSNGQNAKNALPGSARRLSVTHVRHTVVWAVWTGWAGTASGISFRKTKKGTRTLRPLKITHFRRQVRHNEKEGRGSTSVMSKQMKIND